MVPIYRDKILKNKNKINNNENNINNNNINNNEKRKKEKVLRAETNEYRYGSNSGNSSAGVV